MQPSNDIASLLEKYGDRFVIIGGYNTNGLPGRSDAADEVMRNEVRRCFAEYGKHKGYIFFGVKVTNTLDFGEYMQGMMPMVEEAFKCSFESMQH